MIKNLTKKEDGELVTKGFLNYEFKPKLMAELDECFEQVIDYQIIRIE